MNLLFTDLDGTMLRKDHTVSDKLRFGLLTLLKNGHGLIFSSGRPLPSILAVVETLHLPDKNCYVIANNGSLIYELCTKKIIYDIRFDLSLVDPVQKDAQRHGIHIQTYTQSEVVTPSWDEEVISYVERIKIPAICSPRLSDALSQAPYKMLAIDLYDHEKLKDFQAYIDKHYCDKITTLFSESSYLELINKNAGKGNALTFLCQYMSVPVENCYAVGDSYNDLSMIKAAGLGYAMANACDKLKSSADKTTTLDNEHDGIFEILSKHFI